MSDMKEQGIIMYPEAKLIYLLRGRIFLMQRKYIFKILWQFGLLEVVFSTTSIIKGL